MQSIPDAFSRAPSLPSALGRPGVPRDRHGGSTPLSQPLPAQAVILARFRLAGLAAIVWSGAFRVTATATATQNAQHGHGADAILLAERRLREALHVRRACLTWLMRTSMIASAAIAILALTQDSRRVFGETFYGSAPTSILFACVTAAVASAGALATRRETASLARLRAAALALSPEDGKTLALQLRSLGMADCSDVLAAALGAQPLPSRELVPATCPDGNTREVAPAERTPHRC